MDYVESRPAPSFRQDGAVPAEGHVAHDLDAWFPFDPLWLEACDGRFVVVDVWIGRLVSGQFGVVKGVNTRLDGVDCRAGQGIGHCVCFARDVPDVGGELADE